MTKDYFNCFSCHQQGDKKPEGPDPKDGRLIWRWRIARFNPDWILKWIARSAGDPAGHQDAVILSGRSRRHPQAATRTTQIRALRDYIFWFGTHPGQTLPGQVAALPAKVSKPPRAKSKKQL